MILKIILGIYLLITITCFICLSIRFYHYRTCLKMLENEQPSKMKLHNIFLSILILIIESIIPFYNILLTIACFTVNKEEIMEFAIEAKLKNLK